MSRKKFGLALCYSLTKIFKHMKKIFLPVIAVAIFALSSCEKECSCTTNVSGVDTGTATVKTKESSCSKLDTETTALGITTKYTCK